MECILSFGFIAFWINIVTPSIALITTCLFGSIYIYIYINAERQKFYKLSTVDELSSLYNIRFFLEVLRSECKKAEREYIPAGKIFVIMADIDHFKEFNDTYGHQVGDLLIKEVATAIKSSVRSSDVVARYGGDEIIILLRNISDKDAFKVAEKIRNNIQRLRVKYKTETLYVSISIGIAGYIPGDTAEGIIERADKELYKAKRARKR